MNFQSVRAKTWLPSNLAKPSSGNPWLFGSTHLECRSRQGSCLLTLSSSCRTIRSLFIGFLGGMALAHLEHPSFSFCFFRWFRHAIFPAFCSLLVRQQTIWYFRCYWRPVRGCFLSLFCSYLIPSTKSTYFLRAVWRGWSRCRQINCYRTDPDNAVWIQAISS